MCKQNPSPEQHVVGAAKKELASREEPQQVIVVFSGDYIVATLLLWRDALENKQKSGLELLQT